MSRSAAPPQLSDAQRREALAKAALARRRRADVKQALKSGQTTLEDLLTSADEVVAKMKVSSVLEALPGVGPARARKVMERLQIAGSRRMRGLGIKQIDSLRKEFEAR